MERETCVDPEMGLVTVFREVKPFEVDGIRYYPPFEYDSPPHTTGKSMFKLKGQNYGHAGAIVRRVSPASLNLARAESREDTNV